MTIQVLQVTQDPYFNYFFTEVASFIVVLLPVAMLVKLISRS